MDSQTRQLSDEETALASMAVGALDVTRQGCGYTIPAGALLIAAGFAGDASGFPAAGSALAIVGAGTTFAGFVGSIVHQTAEGIVERSAIVNEKPLEDFAAIDGSKIYGSYRRAGAVLAATFCLAVGNAGSYGVFKLISDAPEPQRSSRVISPHADTLKP